MTKDMNIETKKITSVGDRRGWLAEIFNADLVDRFGRVVLVVAEPGAVRGGHHHRCDYEWLTVIHGRGTLLLVDNQTRERTEIELNGDSLQCIRVPLNTTHWVTNTGNGELFLLSLFEEKYNPEDPDTFTPDQF